MPVNSATSAKSTLAITSVQPLSLPLSEKWRIPKSHIKLGRGLAVLLAGAYGILCEQNFISGSNAIVPPATDLYPLVISRTRPHSCDQQDCLLRLGALLVLRRNLQLMLLAASIVFWFTGTSVIRASASDLLYWLVPAAGANFLFMYWVTEKHVLPVLTDVTQFLTIFAVSHTVLTALFRPFGHSVKVTAKGISSSGFIVQWDLLWRFAAIAILTGSGMLLHITDFSSSHSYPGYALTVFWSIANAFLLFLASVICVEPPKRRLDERFSTTEPAIVLLGGDVSIPCRLHDLSLGGACLVRDEGWRNLVGPASLSLDQGRIVIPFDVARRNGPRLALKFHPDRAARRLLIIRLFTGAYDQDVESISVPQVFRTLAKVVVS